MRDRKNFIPNDGYTLPGFAEGQPGFYESVRYRYRPVSAVKQAAFESALELLRDTPTNPARFRKNAEILRGRIVSWDLVDDKGEPLPLTQAAIESLAPYLFWKLFGTVFGRTASDIDPQWEEEAQAEEAKIATDAALAGESVGATREASDAKN